MDTSIRKLTLSCPKLGAVYILDALDDIEPALPGYTFQEGQGRGPSLEYANGREAVQGAMHVVIIVIVLPAYRIDDVLTMVKEVYRLPHLSYWVEPILDFGRLK